jgi:hypothetical protein
MVGWRIGGFKSRSALQAVRLSDKAFGVSAGGAVGCGLAGSMDLVGLTVVHLVGRHQADAGMVMMPIAKKLWQDVLASWMQLKRCGNRA